MRLQDYNYTQAGAYFITIVTQGRLCLFGDVVGEEMRLNRAGMALCQVWESMTDVFPIVSMDKFVVMPNHVHGIVFIREPLTSNASSVEASLVGAREEGRTGRNKTASRTTLTLGDVIGAYKSLTTLEYGKGVRDLGWLQFDKHLWQRSYYERVIRDEKELSEARRYIVNNPRQWAVDQENPKASIP